MCSIRASCVVHRTSHIAHRTSSSPIASPCAPPCEARRTWIVEAPQQLCSAQAQRPSFRGIFSRRVPTSSSHRRGRHSRIANPRLCTSELLIVDGESVIAETGLDHKLHLHLRTAIILDLVEYLQGAALMPFPQPDCRLYKIAPRPGRRV